MRKNNDKLRILLIGNISPRPSGSTLLFQQLLGHLKANTDIELRVINTYRPAHLTTNLLVNLLSAIRTTFQVILNQGWAQVISLHASRPAMMTYGPLLYLISRAVGKPVLFRLFGGALENEYEALSPIGKWVFGKTVLSADLLAVETKNLVGYFTARGARNIKWFSNCTRMAELPQDEPGLRRPCGRFVFLGLVKEEKGIEVILTSVSECAKGVSVDLFGPLEGAYTADDINRRGCGIVRYRGVLTPAQVYTELFGYDALVLPTFYEGEGYPGVIIEAYSHGIPVISTRWRSIPEIVAGDTGILISTHSPGELAAAMNKMHGDPELYYRMKAAVRRKRLEFSDEFWTAQFLKWCNEII